MRGAGDTGAAGKTATTDGADVGMRNAAASPRLVEHAASAMTTPKVRTALRMAERRGSVHALGLVWFTQRELGD
jgi:hypothetical protein